MNTGDSALTAAFNSNGPSAGREEKMRLHAWLVGCWALYVAIKKPDETKQSRTRLMAAGWVLEGRAIPDVFAVPGLFHGTET